MRLLPKSRLAPAHEPPAEEADEASDDDDDCDGDARDGACAEAALVDASAGVIAVCFDIAGDRATSVTSWRSAAYAISDTSDLVVISTTSCTFEAFITGTFVVSRKAFSAGIRIIAFCTAFRALRTLLLYRCPVICSTHSTLSIISCRADSLPGQLRHTIAPARHESILSCTFGALPACRRTYARVSPSFHCCTDPVDRGVPVLALSTVLRAPHVSRALPVCTVGNERTSALLDACSGCARSIQERVPGIAGRAGSSVRIAVAFCTRSMAGSTDTDSVNIIGICPCRTLF
eukprot:XP_001709458.1 Hypothetical protein GL50803_19182 [Giardia lamblia ATCC 50803]